MPFINCIFPPVFEKFSSSKTHGHSVWEFPIISPVESPNYLTSHLYLELVLHHHHGRRRHHHYRQYHQYHLRCQHQHSYHQDCDLSFGDRLTTHIFIWTGTFSCLWWWHSWSCFLYFGNRHLSFGIKVIVCRTFVDVVHCANIVIDAIEVFSRPQASVSPMPLVPRSVNLILEFCWKQTSDSQ